MRSFLSADPNFFYCPAEKCTSGQIHDTDSTGNIFRCNACGFRVCTHHSPHVPFHDDETCTLFDERVARESAMQEEEQRRRDEAEQASVQEVAQSSVECPGCGANIAKNGGCDHMTCKFSQIQSLNSRSSHVTGRRAGCQFQFCYVCRAPYLGGEGILRVGNSAHAKTCRYHSTQLPSYRDWIVEEV
jgi:DNA-directed RNA polymerase subunit RPC12/RpoP